MNLKWIILALTIFVFDGFYSDYISAEEPETEQRRQVTFFTTYGYLDGDEWEIPVRLWVNKKRRWLQWLVTWSMDLTSDYNDDQINIFRNRLRDLVADSKGRRTVSILFDGDQEETRFRIKDNQGEYLRTDRNGIIEGTIRIPAEKAERFLDLQNSEDGWLTVNAKTSRYSGKGRVQLIEPEGLSVISDIDDTIKVSEIPAGARIVIRNTFFKEYSAAPNMADMYTEWSDATFHYVSGSPWQLFNVLSGFLFGDEAGFPEGTFHMKSVRKNPMTITTYRDLREFVTNEMITFDQKISQISRIFEDFPNRQFILVGDSGERDPEVYHQIRERYPGQVKEIYIRDVIFDRVMNPERMANMNIIPAPTILRQGQLMVEDLIDDVSY